MTDSWGGGLPAGFQALLCLTGLTMSYEVALPSGAGGCYLRVGCRQVCGADMYSSTRKLRKGWKWRQYGDDTVSHVCIVMRCVSCVWAIIRPLLSYALPRSCSPLPITGQQDAPPRSWGARNQSSIGSQDDTPNRMLGCDCSKRTPRWPQPADRLASYR